MLRREDPVMEPPEMINAGAIVLKKWEAQWADAAVTAVRESLPELIRFMPWAHEGYDAEAARGFVGSSGDEWKAGTAYNYAVFTTVGELIGSGGLMARVGPAAPASTWSGNSAARDGRTPRQPTVAGQRRQRGPRDRDGRVRRGARRRHRARRPGDRLRTRPRLVRTPPRRPSGRRGAAGPRAARRTRRGDPGGTGRPRRPLRPRSPGHSPVDGVPAAAEPGRGRLPGAQRLLAGAGPRPHRDDHGPAGGAHEPAAAGGGALRGPAVRQ